MKSTAEQRRASASDSRAESAGAKRVPLGEDLAAELEYIHERGLYRHLRRVESAQGPEVTIDGRRCLLLCSNNYLGLASHPEVVAAAQRAIAEWGTSAVSSRLISGHMTPHAALEERIARWKGCERALVFSTGYHANVGVISTLASRGDLILSDELNHASIIDGCRLSRAETAVYRHCDTDHLRELLAGQAARRARRTIVVTESVFSMDGDRAPLADIVAAAREFGAEVMVDEAHAAGVIGPRGAGLAAEQGVTDEIAVHVGTLGKALASFGAYVAGSARLIELLVNRARPFVFTTGLPPAAAAAAHAAIDIAEREVERRTGLLERARSLGERLRKAGANVPSVESQIIPVIVGTAEDAVAVARELLARGVYVAAIRPPTVPEGTSRLRVSLMATHTDEHVERAAGAIADALDSVLRGKR
ncbi:MAG: 8-amino-7-oxononanoate synthase [Deltaproteobacteria bacterium]|nr:MAG: 8-amino-7-oxononanoate synthase [Deltaproteobacteria bacterium]